MTFNFEQWLGQQGILGQSGFYHVVLPIILLVVILYGILEMINIFGDTTKGHKINIIISIILTLFITYSTSYLIWFSTIVVNMSGYLAVILVGVLFLFILYGVIKGENFTTVFGDKAWIKWLIFAICAFVIFMLFRQSGGIGIFGINFNLPHMAISAQTIVLLLVVVGLVALVVWTFLDTSAEGTQKRIAKKAARK